ncbi:MAG: type II/IV secretion system protein, partial [Planctomycetales bacterium]
MDAGEILQSRGLLTTQQLDASRSAQSDGARVDHVAIEMGFVTAEDALKALGDEVGLDFIDLTATELDLSLLTDFPPRLIHRHALFPIRRENGCMVVATSDPFDLYPLDELGAAIGLSIEPVLAGREEISKLIKTHLGVGSETITGLVAAQDADDSGVEMLGEIDVDDSELSEMAQEASVIRLVNEI